MIFDESEINTIWANLRAVKDVNDYTVDERMLIARAHYLRDIAHDIRNAWKDKQQNYNIYMDAKDSLAFYTRWAIEDINGLFVEGW